VEKVEDGGASTGDPPVMLWLLLRAFAPRANGARTADLRARADELGCTTSFVSTNCMLALDLSRVDARPVSMRKGKGAARADVPDVTLDGVAGMVARLLYVCKVEEV